MSRDSGWESMQDMFVFETLQLMEQLEQIVLESEKASSFVASIHDIFRIMHTIKGNAAMMQVENITSLAHSLEDLFFFLREKNPPDLDYVSLTDILLKAIDYTKYELADMKKGVKSNKDPGQIIELSREYLAYYKNPTGITIDLDIISAPDNLEETEQGHLPESECTPLEPTRYQALVFFEDNCGMENVRAYLLVHKLEELAVTQIRYAPADIVENEASSAQICNEGFQVEFSSEFSEEEIVNHLQKTAFVKSLEIHELQPAGSLSDAEGKVGLESTGASVPATVNNRDDTLTSSRKAALISVNVSKLDRLMDLVGELVIAEAMVTQNPELAGLSLDNFFKASRQLSKITHDLQDIVMSIRMVPLAMTFQKMHRIVRDMSHSLNKQVRLELIGEDTEVDKNIIEQISDPLIHLIRNAVDHGIEESHERQADGKAEYGLIQLEAKNAGGDVWIIIRDDGRGLDKKKILAKAQEQGLLTKGEHELTERDIYACILLPGFSTKKEVSEFSGRGVGMDVVNKNISHIGGSVLVDSTPGQGTVISLKIPLTLAIIEGMVIKVGPSSFTIPMTSIRESFSVHDHHIITDPTGNEMILIRGEAYSVLRLHQLYQLQADSSYGQAGIIIMVEYEGRSICLLADALLGEQQVVIKPLPVFLQRIRGKVCGISSCTLLGDGTISLILDVADLLNNC